MKKVSIDIEPKMKMTPNGARFKELEEMNPSIQVENA